MKALPIGRILLALLIALLAQAAPFPAASQQSHAENSADEYARTIQPIFDRRCIACHSCYNAPCQLNLQSFPGASRGAIQRNIYDPSRLTAVPPTRVGIDATTVSGWRAKGFYDVLGARDPQRSLLLRLTTLRASNPAAQPTNQVADSQLCVADVDDGRVGAPEHRAALGMPYGLPPLMTEEIAALQAWIERGAPGPRASEQPERATIAPSALEEIRAWEQFLNDAAPRQQLVSRYIFEHLFLASLYFASNTAKPDDAAERPRFFRLVRSRAACDAGGDEIATRRPNDPPGVARAYYCLRPMTGTIVDKTHIPFELSAAKLARIKSIFFEEDWRLDALPTYREEEAANPFVTFAAIPVRARYQFLLDNAHFHVATFIKGPVCNGSAAVNSIQDHFFVFFLKPEADNMVMSHRYAATVQDKLVLPGMWGSDVRILQDAPFFLRLVEYREAYRSLRAASARRLRPKGYGLDDLWNGDGHDPSALLTVFRHDDNAAVFKGAIGDLPKTIFVLDYPLLERLVYNLVVNFDVFGNVGHQVLTRVYMDLIRMEAEELFLSFLPPADRERLRDRWYEGGLLTEIKLRIVFPLTGRDFPTAVEYRSASNRKLEFVQRAIFERLPPAVRGARDPINWRQIKAPANAPPRTETTPLFQTLRSMASVPAVPPTPFARYFPDLAFLIVKQRDGDQRLFSIVHNREHQNVSWIFGENLRLAPSEDTLTIAEGVRGAYPNMLFVLDEAQLGEFARMTRAITSPEAYGQLVDRFGIKRSSPQFWQMYDLANAISLRQRPVDGAILDLTRYALDPRK